MNSRFFKSLKGVISKISNQRVITLFSIFTIIVLFTLLVAYNTTQKSHAVSQQATDTQESSTKSPQAQAIAAPTSTPPVSPSPSATPANEEEKAMQEINNISVTVSSDQKTGKIAIDGASLAGTITQLVADRYKDFYKGIQVSIGISGSDEGLKSFASGKLDMCGTLRKITPEEAQSCSVNFMEVKLAYDTVVVVTNKENNWVNSISITELRKIWDSKGKARRWNDVNASWPSEALKPFSSDEASLTQSFFCDALFSNNAAKFSRFNTAVDTNKAFIESIMSEKGSVGFCSYSFYDENKDKFKALAITTANGPVVPSYDTIKSGTYSPFSRIMYLYINKNSLQKAYIKDFVKVYIENVSKFVKASGYLPCEDAEYKAYLSNIG